jgi:hypothetical protein
MFIRAAEPEAAPRAPSPLSTCDTPPTSQLRKESVSREELVSGQRDLESRNAALLSKIAEWEQAYAELQAMHQVCV